MIRELWLAVDAYQPSDLVVAALVVLYIGVAWVAIGWIAAGVRRWRGERIDAYFEASDREFDAAVQRTRDTRCDAMRRVTGDLGETSGQPLRRVK